MLTDGAKICIDDIHYDEAKGVVEIQMQRKELTGFKKSLLGGMRPVYGQTRVKSILTIRQVEEIEIKVDDRLAVECSSCFTLLFGLKVDGNRLYLGSAEESRGIPLCQIFIEVKVLSIELGDEEKK